VRPRFNQVEAGRSRVRKAGTGAGTAIDSKRPARGQPLARDEEQIYFFGTIKSFAALATRNLTTVLALIWMASPVWGVASHATFRFASLMDVVNHYDSFKSLHLDGPGQEGFGRIPEIAVIWAMVVFRQRGGLEAVRQTRVPGLLDSKNTVTRSIKKTSNNQARCARSPEALATRLSRCRRYANKQTENQDFCRRWRSGRDVPRQEIDWFCIRANCESKPDRKKSGGATIACIRPAIDPQGQKRRYIENRPTNFSTGRGFRPID
jgi:hypothetical protein